MENFKGSLLGQCVGDFLGFLVEGESPAQCKSFVDNEILAYPGKISEKLIKRAQGKGITVGQYSDDSQMTREMIQSIVEIVRESFSSFLFLILFKKKREHFLLKNTLLFLPDW